MKQYHIIVDKKQQGSIPESELVEGVRSGRYPANMLVWCEGMEDWKPAASLPPLADVAKTAVPATPAEAGRRGISHKGWVIIGCACAAVAAAIVALMLLLPRSFKSDEDVKEFIEEKVAAISDVDSKIAKLCKNALKDMKAGLKDSGTEEQRAGLAWFVGACGEKGAIEYLFEEKEFGEKEAAQAFFGAALHGHMHILKYLREKDLAPDADDQEFYLDLMNYAAMCGQLEVCKYIIDEGLLDFDAAEKSLGVGKNDIFKRLVQMKEGEVVDLLTLRNALKEDSPSYSYDQVKDAYDNLNSYAHIAAALGAYRGKKMEVDELMGNVAKVAEYFKEELGAELKPDDEAAGILDECPNPGIRKLFK